MARHVSCRLAVTMSLCLGYGFSLVSAPAPVFREKLDPRVMTNSIGMKLVCVPAGEFAMGSPSGEADRADDEGVSRRVKIPSPFYMGVYEVTQDEYRTVMGVNPSWFSSAGKGKARVAGSHTGRFPVESVYWYDARAFCAKLGERPGEKGRVYRLPTEAEWEYACRAGTTTATSFGDKLSSKQANFDGDTPYNGGVRGPSLGRTCQVGSYPPNAFGLYDMHGNVWEWTADWYDKEFKKRYVNEPPKGQGSDCLPVLRGGAWGDRGRNCRSAYRYRHQAYGKANDGGFRVVFDPPPASR